MPLRNAVVPALALALVATPGAVAAERRRPHPCPLHDPAGDTAVSGIPGVPSGAADVVCGAFGVGRTQIVGALRMHDLADRLAVADYGWLLTAQVGGVKLEFAAAQPAAGAPRGTVRVGGEDVAFSLNVSGNTLMWRVERAGLKPFDASAGRCLVLAASTELAGVTMDEAGGTPVRKCAKA